MRTLSWWLKLWRVSKSKVNKPAMAIWVWKVDHGRLWMSLHCSIGCGSGVAALVGCMRQCQSSSIIVLAVNMSAAITALWNSPRFMEKSFAQHLRLLPTNSSVAPILRPLKATCLSPSDRGNIALTTETGTKGERAKISRSSEKMRLEAAMAFQAQGEVSAILRILRATFTSWIGKNTVLGQTRNMKNVLVLGLQSYDVSSQSQIWLNPLLN